MPGLDFFREDMRHVLTGDLERSPHRLRDEVVAAEDVDLVGGHHVEHVRARLARALRHYRFGSR